MCLQSMLTTAIAAKAAAGKALKRGRALSVREKRDAMFKKYDKDGDGFLSKKEIASYAKAEFGFGISAEAVANIMPHLANGSTGVPCAKFHALKVAVGIAREEAAALERKRQAEARRRALE